MGGLCREDPLVLEGVAESIDELRHEVARLEGELTATRAQVATLESAEQQLRAETEACKVGEATARAELAQLQRRADEHDEVARKQIAALEEQLAQARRLEEQAESERAAVIAALGRRARRQLEARGEPEDPTVP
jgi:chromosome segregation ATPase